MENREPSMSLEEALSKESVGLEEVAIISANLQFVSEKDAKRLGLTKEWRKANDLEEEDVHTEAKGKKSK